MIDTYKYRLVDIDVTPHNRRNLAYLLPRDAILGEYVIAEWRLATNLAYDFLAAEYSVKGCLGMRPLLADVVTVFSLPEGKIVIQLGVPEGTGEADIEAFRVFCRDGIAARIPTLPACACGAPSTVAWAGRAACEEHLLSVYDGHPPKPSTKDAQAA